MEYTGCYDCVVDVADEATQIYSRHYKRNDEKYQQLQNICECVDELFREVDGVFVDVSVNDVTKQLTIDIGCDDVIFENGRSHMFFNVIQMFDSFEFSKTKDGYLRISLNLAMWERTSE